MRSMDKDPSPKWHTADVVVGVIGLVGSSILLVLAVWLNGGDIHYG